MMRRRDGVFGLLLLFLAFCALVTLPDAGTRISNRGSYTYFWFWDADSSAYADSSHSRQHWAYPSYLAGGDTVSAGTELDYVYPDAWRLYSTKDEIWRIWRYDTLGTSLVIDSLYVGAGQVGDSAIASTSAFMADVVPSAALVSPVVVDSAYVTDLGWESAYGDSAWLTYINFPAAVADDWLFNTDYFSRGAAGFYIPNNSIPTGLVVNGTLLDEDCSGSMGLGLSKLATTGTLQSDVVETDTLAVEDDSYITIKNQFKVPATWAVLDTFIHYSDDGVGTNLANHNIYFPGLLIGDFLLAKPYRPQLGPILYGSSGSGVLAFAVACTVADSASVFVGNAEIVDYNSRGDSVLCIYKELIGDWAGD